MWRAAVAGGADGGGDSGRCSGGLAGGGGGGRRAGKSLQGNEKTYIPCLVSYYMEGGRREGKKVQGINADTVLALRGSVRCVTGIDVGRAGGEHEGVST